MAAAAVAAAANVCAGRHLQDGKSLQGCAEGRNKVSKTAHSRFFEALSAGYRPDPESKSQPYLSTAPFSLTLTIHQP